MNVLAVNLDVELTPSGDVAQELNVGGSVVTAAALPSRASHAMLCVKANSVRVTFDGTDPASAGAGAILTAGIYFWPKGRVTKARFIESTGSAAAVVRIEPMSAP